MLIDTLSQKDILEYEGPNDLYKLWLKYPFHVFVMKAT